MSEGFDFVELVRQKIRVQLPERSRERNTYICASIGSGKSELMKLLIHSTMQKGDAAVILLDPTGRTAKETRFKELARNDRLVWIDPYLAKGYVPTINPLEVHGPFPGIGEKDAKDIIAENVMAVLMQMLKGMAEKYGNHAQVCHSRPTRRTGCDIRE